MFHQNTDMYVKRTVVCKNTAYVDQKSIFAWLTLLHHESPLHLAISEFYMDWFLSTSPNEIQTLSIIQVIHGLQKQTE